MIYLDNAATTQVRPEVVDFINEYMKDKFYNPSSLYRSGLEIEKDIEKSRKIIGDYLGVGSKEIYFTPGGTWSNNIIIQGVLGKGDKGRVISSLSEHSSVYKLLENYKDRREVIFLDLDEKGRLSLGDLESKITEDTSLVSIMHVNNELGTVQDLAEISKIIKSRSQALFHVDGVQGFRKVPIDLKKAGVDFYTMSSHKIHGPKGIGAMYVRSNLSLRPLIYGGGQERGLAPGTENVPGIMGFARAALLMEDDKTKVKEIRDLIIQGIKKISGHRFNSAIENFSPYIINVGFSGIKSQVLLHMLDDDGICVSSGSACSGGKISRVLEAIRVPEEYIDGVIRISYSDFNSKEEVPVFLKSLEKNIELIRKIIGG